MSQVLQLKLVRELEAQVAAAGSSENYVAQLCGEAADEIKRLQRALVSTTIVISHTLNNRNISNQTKRQFKNVEKAICAILKSEHPQIKASSHKKKPALNKPS